MLAKRQQFNVYLSPDLIKAMKHAAIDEQLSLSDLVERQLRAYIEGREPHDEQRGSPGDRGPADGPR